MRERLYIISPARFLNAVNNNAINIQNINPIEKWMEALEEIKKLYERLLQSEKEKVELLERVLNQKK